MKRLVVLGVAVAVASGLTAGAFGHSNPAPPAIAAVGSLRVVSPSGSMQRRYFSSCSYAVTGDHGDACVRGVVVASYPLKKNPELGGKGASFRPDGVLFELYRAPRQQPVAARTVPPPLSLADLRPIGRGMHPTGEQREVFFSAKGANYWAFAWVGKHASKSERDDLTGVIGSIQVVK